MSDVKIMYTFFTELMNALEYMNREYQFPKIGEEFFSINGCGEIERRYWQDKAEYRDAKILGNVFRTEKEAKDVVGRLFVITDFRRKGRSFDARFQNYRAVFDHRSGSVRAEIAEIASEGTFFSTAEACMKAVQDIGGDKVFVKYVLGMNN